MTSSVITALVPPAMMMMLRPVFGELFNYLPAGPTPVLFAILAQYYAMVPHMYKYRVATSAAPPSSEPFSGLTLSDKSYKYAIAFHLAVLQWPGSLIGAAAGWVVGHSWREGVLPAAVVQWRVPGWMVGLRTQRRTAEFEGLRRRLEEENAPGALSTAMQGQAEGSAERRRTMASRW